MTAERKKQIAEWCLEHCWKCANCTDVEGDGCAACEVKKDVGIACIHYEEEVDGWATI